MTVTPIGSTNPYRSVTDTASIGWKDLPDRLRGLTVATLGDPDANTPPSGRTRPSPSRRASPKTRA